MADTTPTPAYRIETERLVIRCWEPRDAPLIKAAIDSSLDHLRPWLPWAWDDPQPLEQKVELLRTFRGRFDLGEDYIYAIFNRDETEVLGGSGLHMRRGPKAREIGYWISAAHVGRGIATETSAALTKVAFEHDGVERVEIHCDPGNVASASIPAKLGYTHEATRRRLPVGRNGEPRDTMIWTIFADEYPASPSASMKIEAFDAAGRRIFPGASQSIE
jgi:RimJ/RimL family protein N-acetyltransferase